MQAFSDVENSETERGHTILSSVEAIGFSRGAGNIVSHCSVRGSNEKSHIKKTGARTGARVRANRGRSRWRIGGRNVLKTGAHQRSFFGHFLVIFWSFFGHFLAQPLSKVVFLVQYVQSVKFKKIEVFFV